MVGPNKGITKFREITEDFPYLEPPLYFKHDFSVGKADFEAFAALKIDSVGTEPDCEYGQVEPKPQNPMEAAKAKNQPPILPNHLVHKVLLNQETAQSCDPSLLPVPNSSQLNHLYAQSIRDDTLALSATHR